MGGGRGGAGDVAHGRADRHSSHCPSPVIVIIVVVMMIPVIVHVLRRIAAGLGALGLALLAGLGALGLALLAALGAISGSRLPLPLPLGPFLLARCPGIGPRLGAGLLRLGALTRTLGGSGLARRGLLRLGALA